MSAADPVVPLARRPLAADGSGESARGFGVDVGRGWFPQDAARHRRDAPRFCPGCGAALGVADGGNGLATEYWVAGDRVFVCVCGDCGWVGDIVLTARVVGHEPEH